VGLIVFFIIKKNTFGISKTPEEIEAERKVIEDTAQATSMATKAIEGTRHALDTSMHLMMQHLNELSRSVDQKISGMERAVGDKLNFSAKEMHETIRHQTSESFKVLRDVTERLTKLDETNKQVVSFADQLQNLQNILKNPKQRGILGEYYLETLLKNVLPPGSFQMQYAFKDNTIVDAVVFVKDKIIPIDSKFSLENYNRLSETSDPVQKEQLEKQFRNDLKARIDETSKYIKPNEQTLDFAFMFIPHEAIYYDLQMPILIGVLYFIFQMPVFRAQLLHFLPSLFGEDGNFKIMGLTATSVMFAGTFFVIMKVFNKLGEGLR
jgi:DNA anti-recombination protein RmuC